MRYIQPKITGVFRAVSTIKNEKGIGPMETGTNVFSTASGYQADE